MRLLDLTADLSTLERPIPLPQGASTLFRPLHPADVGRLHTFLASLSPQTRRFWQRDADDLALASEMCHAIGRYDKLRLTAQETVAPFRVQALIEFSFALPEGDVVRFRSYGLALDGATDCRFGPCVRDDLQGTGLASALMPAVTETARRFGRTRVTLWGGVALANRRAIRFYEKHGFTPVGRFAGPEGDDTMDMMLSLGAGDWGS